jgi:neutral ceramidase
MKTTPIYSPSLSGTHSTIRKCLTKAPAVLLLFFLLSPWAAADGGTPALLAGSSSWEITPAPGNAMSGYGDRNSRPSEGVHDRLHCRCLFLEMNGKGVALVSADMLAFSLDLRKAVMEQIADLPVDLLFLAATHTHSGPGGYEKGWATEKFLMGSYSKEAFDFLAIRIAHAVRDAQEHLVPARIAYGKGSAPELCRNRRHEGGPTDPEVGVLWVEAVEDARPIAMAVNFSAHPTVLGPDNLHYSGDYAGMASTRLEEALGAPVLFFNGTLGDVKPHIHGTREWEAPLQEQYQEAAKIAEELSREVLRVKQGLQPETVTSLAAAERRVSLPKVDLRASCFYYVLTPLVRALFHNLFHDETIFQAVRMNGWVLAGLPAEISTELGKQIRENALARVLMIASLANDTLGYALTPDDYRQGGYEACMTFYGKETGPFFVEQSLSTIEQVIPGSEAAGSEGEKELYGMAVPQK